MTSVSCRFTSFVKFVNRGLGKIETILKTAMSPHEPVDMFIDHYFLLIGDNNLPNYQRILELKGLKRTEQQQMVDLFLKKQAGMDNLQENSAVMSLLQGMPAHVSNQGVVGPSAGLIGNMSSMVLGGGGSSSSGSMTPGSGGQGGGVMRDSNPYQLGNIVTSSILSHSPFAALAAQHLNGSGGNGAGATGADGGLGLTAGGSGLFGLGSHEKESGAGTGSGTAGGAAGQPAGSFAAGAKINVNIRKFVAGMRAKKDQDSGQGGSTGN